MGALQCITVASKWLILCSSIVHCAVFNTLWTQTVSCIHSIDLLWIFLFQFAVILSSLVQSVNGKELHLSKWTSQISVIFLSIDVTVAVLPLLLLPLGLCRYASLFKTVNTGGSGFLTGGTEWSHFLSAPLSPNGMGSNGADSQPRTNLTHFKHHRRTLVLWKDSSFSLIVVENVHCGG